MEETHIESAELNPPESLTATSLQSLNKVFRQGDKVYQVPDENITMIKDTACPASSSISEHQENLDEVTSGESLFKTFAFDNAISQEETEKCLSFWRSVVEKNLEPIKCSLIENVANYQKQLEEKRNLPAKKSKRASKEIVGEGTSKTKPKPNVWYEMLLELQRKRYKETKLLLEKRCRFCGYASSPEYQPEDPALDNQKMIAEMSTWEPKSHKRQSPLVKNIAVPKSVENYSTSKAVAGNSEDKPEEILQENKPNYQLPELLKQIKESSDKIQYVDAIERKKIEGSYGKWRKNFNKLCNCNRSDCDCSSNPPISSTPGSSVSSAASWKPEPERESSESPIQQDQSSIDPQPIHITTENVQLLEAPDLEPPASATQLENDREQPGKLTELYKDSDLQRISYASCKVNAQKSPQDQELTATASEVPGTQNTPVSGFTDDELEEIQLAISPQIAPRKSILKSREEAEEMNKTRLKKSLSVVIACCCSYPNCDCTEALKVSDLINLSVQSGHSFIYTFFSDGPCPCKNNSYRKSLAVLAKTFIFTRQVQLEDNNSEQR
ncbi:hypothetical protein HUJ05_000540 [Dendroctonus ponderosae]|nr:hypothetical protein HUJ05_000540 [Dendroctonus ponderosae]